jgi:hypothetical protein
VCHQQRAAQQSRRQGHLAEPTPTRTGNTVFNALSNLAQHAFDSQGAETVGAPFNQPDM